MFAQVLKPVLKPQSGIVSESSPNTDAVPAIRSSVQEVLATTPRHQLALVESFEKIFAFQNYDLKLYGERKGSDVAVSVTLLQRGKDSLLTLANWNLLAPDNKESDKSDYEFTVKAKHNAHALEVSFDKKCEQDDLIDIINDSTRFEFKVINRNNHYEIRALQDGHPVFVCHLSNGEATG